MENHSDTDSSQILGDWDFPLPVDTKGKAKATNEVDKERGSTSTVGRGKEDAAKKRVLPPWADPSWEWGGGKWKVDGRTKKRKKEEKKKESDEHVGSGAAASDLSIEDLMAEYYSLPPQIAEWFWCIEYVAKFAKDIGCLLELMDMGYPCKHGYGRRINEFLSLRFLEYLFDPIKNDARGVGVAEPRIEFDLSLSNTHVLNAVQKDIPVSELRPGMLELSKFNVLPFIAHKNMCLPQCALEKLREMSLMENQTGPGPSKEANDPVLRDDRSVHMDVCEEYPIGEQQVNIGSEQTNIKKKDKVIVIDDEDDPRQTNEKDDVIVIDGDDTADEPISNNGNTTCKTFVPSSDARVKCAKDGTWLISGSDDESDMVKGPALANKNMNIPSSSRTRHENVCCKCEKDGTLLVCSRSECAAKVHKECLNCPVNFDEDGNFHCPVCWYDRVTMDYHESKKLMSIAKGRLVKFFPVVSRRSKRL